MKVVVRNILVCFLILSPAPCRAVTLVEQDFNALYNAGNLTITSPSYTLGTTDFVTYTCSNKAKFFYYGDPLEIAICLDKSGAQVITTPIQNLDSISITISPEWDNNITDVFTFEILEDGDSEWKTVTTKYQTNTQRTLKLPKVADYSLRITRKSTDVYIKEIDYYCVDPLSGCPNCFIYKP